MFIFISWISLALATPEGWDNIGTTNGVEVSRKKVSGKNLFAFRGEATTDIPVAQLSAIISDETLGTEWVDMMVASKKIKDYSSNSYLVHQSYDIPWPMDDRDYVFKKTIKHDSEKKSVIITLSSVEDPAVPAQAGYVRAEGEKTFWKLEALPSGQTRVVVEVMTDPKGSMPDWLVNSVQEDWPHKTINALFARAKKGGVTADPKCAGWQ